MTLSRRLDADPRRMISLLSRIEDLTTTTLPGQYGPDELKLLSQLVVEARTILSLPEQRLSDESGVSIAVIRNAMGGGRPRLTNFFGILSGLRECVAQDLANRGILSKSYYSDSVPRVRLLQFSSDGKVQKLIADLDEFRGSLKGSNDPDIYIDLDSKDTLVELLENIIQQLKSPLVDTKILAGLSNTLRLFARSVGEKVKEHSTQQLANSIISYISKIFGIGS